MGEPGRREVMESIWEYGGGKGGQGKARLPKTTGNHHGCLSP